MTAGLSLSFSVAATQAHQRRKTASHSFSIRLTSAERRHLEGEAGAQALGTYVRARLLDGAPRRRSSVSAADRTLLSQILGKLGQLQLASNLSDLSAAAKAGAIVMSPDLEQDVRSACRDLRDIRSMLMRALGLEPEARA